MGGRKNKAGGVYRPCVLHVWCGQDEILLVTVNVCVCVEGGGAWRRAAVKSLPLCLSVSVCVSLCVSFPSSLPLLLPLTLSRLLSLPHSLPLCS